MNPRRSPVLVLILATAIGFAAAIDGQTEPRRPAFLAELSAGPLLGIDRPIRGCSGALLIGLAYPPFEAGLRAGAAYDAILGIGLLRFDLELGLGGGLHAIVGGLLPLGELALTNPAGTVGARVPVTAGPWPDRFGLSSTLFEPPWRLLGASLRIDAEFVYTDYRLSPPGSVAARGDTSVLSGAAAFAAGVEATIALRLRWGEWRKRQGRSSIQY